MSVLSRLEIHSQNIQKSCQPSLTRSDCRAPPRIRFLHIEKVIWMRLSSLSRLLRNVIDCCNKRSMVPQSKQLKRIVDLRPS